MFINNVQYNTDSMKNVNDIRNILFASVYADPSKIEMLKSIISKYISCSSIDFLNGEFSFRIRVKRTNMCKIKGFNHNPYFYYSIVPSIFSEFIRLNDGNIINYLITSGVQSPRSYLDSIYHNSAMMSNLCTISCISDNVLLFKL